MSKTVAVMIKHPGRSYDCRVNLYEVDDEATYEEIRATVMSEMLGPFQVVDISSRVDTNVRGLDLDGYRKWAVENPTLARESEERYAPHD